MARKLGAGVGDPAIVARLGLTPGTVVQEFLYDADVDEDLRAAIAQVTGTAIVGEEYGDVTDAAIVWYRNEDGDLADLLMDCQTLLDDGGKIWLFTPKTGRPGHVEQRDIEEGASLSGLHATSTIVAGEDWAGTQLVDKGRHR